MFRSILVVCAVVSLLAAPSAVLAIVVSGTVHDGGNFNLDGNVGATTAPNPTFVIGTPGALNQTTLWHVSKIKLDFLPAEVLADSSLINSVTLSLPDQDQLRNGTPGIHPFTLDHFVTTDNTVVTAADGGFGVPLTPADFSVTPFGGGRHPLVIDLTRVALQDVTAQVKDDIDNGRPLSSWRWGINEQNATLTTSNPGGDNYTFPDADGVGTSFDFGQLVTLTVDYVPEPTTGILLVCGSLALLRRRDSR